MELTGRYGDGEISATRFNIGFYSLWIITLIIVFSLYPFAMLAFGVKKVYNGIVEKGQKWNSTIRKQQK